jgi:hypothetical protein
MKKEIEILETLTPELNYLLNEGVCITIEEKTRAEFLLSECLKYIEETETVLN